MNAYNILGFLMALGALAMPSVQSAAVMGVFAVLWSLYGLGYDRMMRKEVHRDNAVSRTSA